MKSFLQLYLPWGVFAGFAVAAAAVSWHPSIFSFETNAAGKAAAYLGFMLFLGFTIYCSARENFFAAVRRVSRIQWGRQISVDLYIGLFMHIAFIAATGESGWKLLFWIIPFLCFGNLATLLYLAFHFDAIAARLIAA